jgi:hypothetical protein
MESFHHGLPSSFIVCAPILSLQVCISILLHNIVGPHAWSRGGCCCSLFYQSLSSVLPLLIPPVRSYLLLLLMGLSIVMTSRRRGLAIQLVLVLPVTLLGRLVLSIGVRGIDQGTGKCRLEDLQGLVHSRSTHRSAPQVDHL